MAAVYAHAGPGQGPALQPWPLLAWTEKAGVVIEDVQTPVEIIGHLAAEGLDAAQIAATLGTTEHHVRQALSYLRAVGQ
jgi:hypothetical protein